MGVACSSNGAGRVDNTSASNAALAVTAAEAFLDRPVDPHAAEAVRVPGAAHTFQGRADRPVNYVNAPLIARERGIEVKEERSQSARDYTNLVRVEIRTNDERTRVAGTLIGSDNRQWLVSALGFELDLELAPLLVLFRYDDVPGVIGRVGTLFGDAGVNIAHMTVSRTRRGEKALMILTVDSKPSPELVERIRAEGFDDARVIELA